MLRQETIEASYPIFSHGAEDLTYGRRYEPKSRAHFFSSRLVSEAEVSPISCHYS
jgi:hypothetical protein